MQNRILIADISDYKFELENLFKDTGYITTFCDSAFDAISKLRAYDYDLVISEVELPGDNAFDLYEYIEENYPYIPTIMITDKNIDLFFERIFSQGIGNVLHKPVVRSEMLMLAEKLIKKENIFGLKNYFEHTDFLKKVRIKKSSQINKAINMIIDQMNDWGFSASDRTSLNLILNEMSINAVYHSHGLTAEKLKRKPVTLKEGQHVDLHFCKSGNSYGISITDYNGKLTREKILESINNVIIQNNLIEKAIETGEDITEFISESGRGIDLVRKLSGEYYFIIRKDFRTEIILIFSDKKNEAGEESSSLKIIEDAV